MKILLEVRSSIMHYIIWPHSYYIAQGSSPTHFLKLIVFRPPQFYHVENNE